MSTSDEEFLQKLREAFAIEAGEHLQAMGSGLLDLESKPAADRQKEIIETTFREAHSLKGAARAVNRADIESVCQAIETVFAAWKKNGPNQSPAAFDVLNRAVDLLGKLLALSGVTESAPVKNEIAETLKQLGRLPAPGQAVAPPMAAAPMAGTPAPVVEMTPEERPIGRLAVPEAPHAEVSVSPGEPRVAEPHGPATHEPERLAVSETVRIPMAKMDSLLLQAEEMLAVKLAWHQHVTDLREISRLMETWKKEWTKTFGEGGTKAGGQDIEHFLEWNHGHMRTVESKVASVSKAAENEHRSIGAMVDKLLDDAKRLVMLPFATLLEVLPKVVRDLARDQGKVVDLAIQGRGIEIDKRILEEMKDPLIHLVRNAVDHGIESPQVRAQAQKPARATMRISVSRVDGNKVEILVSDDGGGIDIAKVKASAVKSGILTGEEAAHRTDQEALSLIFQSGVSTSPMITSLSGRGLGMAIVGEKVEKLGGNIQIDSKLHEGTTFRIVLPVTLSTFKGLLVEAAGQTFVIPTSNVERVVRLKRTEVQSVENRETIPLKGQALSLVSLGDVLELPPRENAGDQATLLAVVLGAGEKRVAFSVDDVLNEQEVLVKNLGKLLERVRNVAGATVLGSGKVVPILNASDLLKSAVKAGGNRSKVAAAREKTETAAQSLLVVDDSVTSRMLLKGILESAGYKVKTAVDGVDAWTALKTAAFDLVVTDVEMPRMNGFDLTAKIRADKKLGELPVVLVTALETREHRERGVDAGANAYIVKSSFDQSDLLDVIRRMV